MEEPDTTVFDQSELPRQPDATTMRKFAALVTRLADLVTADVRAKLMRGLLAEQGDRERLTVI